METGIGGGRGLFAKIAGPGFPGPAQLIGDHLVGGHYLMEQTPSLNEFTTFY